MSESCLLHVASCIVNGDRPRFYERLMAAKIAQAAFHGAHKAVSQGVVRFPIFWRVGGGGVKWPVVAQGGATRSIVRLAFSRLFSASDSRSVVIAEPRCFAQFGELGFRAFRCVAGGCRFSGRRELPANRFRAQGWPGNRCQLAVECEREGRCRRRVPDHLCENRIAMPVRHRRSAGKQPS